MTWAVVLVLAATATAGAQRPGSAEARREEARDHFYAGALLYQEGDYEAALAEFEASHRLAPAPVATFNIGQTLHVLRRYHEAVEAFRRYLAEGGDTIPADRRVQVERTIAALSRRIAWITLAVEPRDAEVRVDGRPVEVGVPLPLSAGRRTLEVTAEGYVAVADDLTVVGRTRRTVAIRLAPRETAGTVRLTSDPPRARLLIDGLEVGEAPVERRVSRGGHVIEADLPGREHYRASIDLAPRQMLDLQVVLQEVRDPGLLEQWWFWAGASAVVVATIVVIAVVAQPADPQPISGNSHDGVIAVLRAP